LVDFGLGIMPGFLGFLGAAGFFFFMSKSPLQVDKTVTPAYPALYAP
jgi:hypothetical protein